MNTGVRQGSGSLRRNVPPPARNSLESRGRDGGSGASGGGGNTNKRAQAASSSKLAPTTVQPKVVSLSKVYIYSEYALMFLVVRTMLKNYNNTINEFVF